MIKLYAHIIFAIIMLFLGVIVLCFPDEIRSIVYRVTKEKEANITQTVWSMRFGGFVAIMMGLFVLWMSWKSH